MKLIRMTAFGGPDVLTLVEAPVPTPGPGEVLIKVDAAAVNFADVLRRRADAYPFPTSLPFTPGSEVAGVVEALGDGAAGPPPGTPVFALVGGDGSTGYAQYALADAPQVVPIPPGVGPDEAAGIVVAGATATLALLDVGGLEAGQTVLVEGAGGGVGQYAVQIARLVGATVVGAAGSAARRDAALAAGADHVVDNTAPGWAAELRELTGGAGVDLALHLGGAATVHGVLDVLAPFGRVVVLGLPGGDPLTLDAATALRVFHAPAPNQSLHAFNLGLWFGLRPQAAVAALGRLVGWVASGQVAVPVGTVLPLEQAAEAHRLLEARATTGKIVLRPWA